MTDREKVHPESWGDRGDALRRKGLFEEALECYLRALRGNPCDTVSREAYVRDLIGKAECLEKLCRCREAARCREEARGFFPGT